MHRRLLTVLAAVLVATPLTLAASTPPAATPTPTPTAAPVDPPSIAQLCAATGVDEVDELLTDLARTDLVGELSPLLTLLVPDTDSAELDASVQLEDVRQRLNCAPPTTTTPAPATAPDDELPGLDDDEDFDQIDDVPVGAADTGGGPAT